MKKILVLLLLTGGAFAQDTSKVVFQKIDQKILQIKKQAHKPTHSFEDLYSLNMTMWKTVNESHALSKVLLQKQDSAVAALVEQKKVTTLVLQNTISLNYKLQSVTADNRSFTLASKIMKMLAFYCSIGLILMWLCEILALKYFKHVHQLEL